MNIYNYNHLFYFYVTAKLKGVTIASRHLNTSQSSLSTQLKTLEAVLGKKLFKKSGRKIELTESGKEMFNYCRRAFEVFDEMFDQLDKKKSSMGVRISLGVCGDIERPFITDCLSKVSRQYDQDQRPLLHLISLASSQLIQLLRLGEIDLLLTTSSVVDHDLETLGAFEFPVGAFCAPELVERSPEKSLEACIRSDKIPFVLPSKLTSLRAEVDEYFIKKNLRPVCIFESNIISSVIRAAVDKLGATLLPQVYVLRELKSEKLVSLNKKSLWRHRMSLLAARHQLEEGRENFATKLIQQLELIAAKTGI